MSRYLLLVLAVIATAPVSAAHPPAHSPQRNPVVLIHGFKDSSAKMQRMARALRAEGWEVFTPTLKPSWGQVGNEELARQLADFIEQNVAPGQRLDLVGFSMGGIVSRYYLQRLGGAARVDRFVAISVPQNGTWFASVFPVRLLRLPGAVQLRRGSPFLADLNRDADALKTVRVTSLWTPLDLTIVPASSSRVPFGAEVRMWVLFHPLMVLERRCVRAVAAALKS